MESEWVGVKSIDVVDTRSSQKLNVPSLINSQNRILLNLIRILPM